MGDNLRDERLRDWIASCYREGYTVDQMRGILAGYGYNVAVVDGVIESVIHGCGVSADKQSFRVKRLVKGVMAELLNLDVKMLFRKSEYVLAHPVNFIDEIRGLSGETFSKALAYVFLNICVFSFFRSGVVYFFEGSLLYFAVNILYFVLLWSVLFAVSGYVVHRIIRMMGGIGSFVDTMQVLAYSWGVIVFAPLPYLWVLPLAYGVLLGVFNVAIVHKVDKMGAGIAVVVPVLIAAVAAVIIYVLTGSQA